MKYLRLLLSLLLCLTANNIFAQSEANASFTKAMSITDADPENYIAPLKALKNIPVDEDDLGGLSMWLQAMMTYNSFLGDYDSTLYYSDARHRDLIDTIQTKVDTNFVLEHEFIDATHYITDKAKQHQVTMINEAHHSPFHRAFIMEMLVDFREAGYDYLAIETLQDSLINVNQKLTYQTGYYSREPLFGELIRYALRLGFHLVPYESQEKCDNKSSERNYCNSFRDSIMAVNLSKVIEKDNQAKILVYAGYDHVHKGNSNGWKKMAEYFWEMTGVEPFSIDQTAQIEHFYPQREEKEFAAVNSLKQIKKPVVAIKNGKAWHGKFVDVSVIYPRYRHKKHRPSFYQIGGLRYPYEVDDINLSNGYIVQAFYKNEEPGIRIPADQLVIGKKKGELYLFPGDYILEIKDELGILKKKREICIN